MDLLNIALFPWKKSAPFYLSLSPYVCSSLGMFVYIYIHIIYISEDTRVRQNQMEA